MKITRTVRRDVTSHCAVTDGLSVETPCRFLQHCSTQGQTQSHILITVKRPSEFLGLQLSVRHTNLSQRWYWDMTPCGLYVSNDVLGCECWQYSQVQGQRGHWHTCITPHWHTLYPPHWYTCITPHWHTPYHSTLPPTRAFLLHTATCALLPSCHVATLCGHPERTLPPSSSLQ
jgi:hypothetical protein